MKKQSKKLELTELKEEVIDMAMELGQMKRLKRNNQIIDTLQSNDVTAIKALHKELEAKIKSKKYKQDWEAKVEGKIS